MQITYCWRDGYCYSYRAVYIGDKLSLQWDEYDWDMDISKILQDTGCGGFVGGFAKVEIGQWIEEEGEVPPTLEEFNELQSSIETQDMFGGLNGSHIRND